MYYIWARDEDTAVSESAPRIVFHRYKSIEAAMKYSEEAQQDGLSLYWVDVNKVDIADCKIARLESRIAQLERAISRR